jgi:hypothetical protein
MNYCVENAHIKDIGGQFLHDEELTKILEYPKDRVEELKKPVEFHEG